MSGSNVSPEGEPRWRRALRFVTGAAIASVLVRTSVRFAMFVPSAWRDGAEAEAYLTVAAAFVATAVLGAFGVSLMVHAVRGTRPRHPLLPFLVAVPILLGVSVHRAGGLAPIVAGEQGVAVSQLLSLAVIAIAVVVHVIVHELGHVALERHEHDVLPDPDLDGVRGRRDPIQCCFHLVAGLLVEHFRKAPLAEDGSAGGDQDDPRTPLSFRVKPELRSVRRRVLARLGAVVRCSRSAFACNYQQQCRRETTTWSHHRRAFLF